MLPAEMPEPTKISLGPEEAIEFARLDAELRGFVEGLRAGALILTDKIRQDWVQRHQKVSPETPKA